MSQTRAFIESFWSVRLQDLGQADRTALAGLVLDHTGVTAAGSATETARSARVAMAAMSGPVLESVP